MLTALVVAGMSFIPPPPAPTPPTTFTREQIVQVIQQDWEGSSSSLCANYPRGLATLTPVVGEAGAHRYIQAFIIDEIQVTYNVTLDSEARATLIFWLRAACS